MNHTTHTQRVRTELKACGISSIAMLRFTGRYLPTIIHENEHIKAAVFGHHKQSEALFGIAEGMLVATDLRIIYLNHKPGFTTMDEVSYEVVTGVNVSSAGVYSSMTLFTKVNNYTISFARFASIKKFMDYIEEQRIDAAHPIADKPEPVATPIKASADEKTTQFLRQHRTAVLSTMDRTGNVTGAVVFYGFDSGCVYIVTKNSTSKAHNMMTHRQVALTVYDADYLQTVQVQGIAEVETDPAVRQAVYDQLAKPYGVNKQTPPVAKIQDGSFIVFRITPQQFSYSDFS